jgi:hypothetical protein
LRSVEHLCYTGPMNGDQHPAERERTEAGGPEWGEGEAGQARGGGVYRRFLSEEELAALLTWQGEEGPEDELAAVRVAIGRVMAQMQQELTVEEFEGLVQLVFRGADTAGRLLRVRQLLAQKKEGETPEWVVDALEKLGEELGMEL